MAEVAEVDTDVAKPGFQSKISKILSSVREAYGKKSDPVLEVISDELGREVEAREKKPYSSPIIIQLTPEEQVLKIPQEALIPALSDRISAVYSKGDENLRKKLEDLRVVTDLLQGAEIPESERDSWLQIAKEDIQDMQGYIEGVKGGENLKGDVWKIRFIIERLKRKPKRENLEFRAKEQTVDEEVTEGETIPQLYRYDNKSRTWVIVKEEQKSVVFLEKRPFGFLENRRAKREIWKSWNENRASAIISSEQLTYLPQGQNYRIALDKLAFDSLSGNLVDEIYLGVMIPDKDLLKYLQKLLGLPKQQDMNKQKLPEGELNSIEVMFFNRVLRNVIGKDVKHLMKPRSIWPIFSASNQTGQNRLYFAEVGRINDVRTVIFIAGGLKPDQEAIFRKISEVV